MIRELRVNYLNFKAFFVEDSSFRCFESCPNWTK